MKGLLYQDMVVRPYIPFAVLFFMFVFCPYYAVFKVPALMVMLWLSVALPIAIADSGERYFHFGSYALCSHAVSRKQFLNSKYVCLLILLLIASVFAAVPCILVNSGQELLIAILDLLMTIAMCLLGVSAYLTFEFRNDFDGPDRSFAITLGLAAVNVLLLYLWPGATAMLIAVTVMALIGTAVCYRMSCRYVSRMNF